jgi:hypothetical protein
MGWVNTKQKELELRGTALKTKVLVASGVLPQG